MEQLDFFEMDMSASEILFKKFDITPKLNDRYCIKAKEGKLNGFRAVKAVACTGTLIKFDANSIALSDVWLKLERQVGVEHNGEYAEFVEFAVDQIQKIEEVEPFHFQTNIGSPYRVEMYKDAKATRETVWFSCYYRGTTINGRIILIDFGNENAIILCNKDEIKGFYPLSLEDSGKKKGK